jgi:hypothetical protein
MEFQPPRRSYDGVCHWANAAGARKKRERRRDAERGRRRDKETRLGPQSVVCGPWSFDMVFIGR